MKHLILLGVIFLIGLFTVHAESNNSSIATNLTNCDIKFNFNTSKTYHPWKPMCFYMNETIFNQTVSTEKCYNIIDFIFNEEAMRFKLESTMNISYDQYSILNLIINKCNPTECVIQVIKCVDVCAQHKVIECAECIGKIFLSCCDCILPKHMCIE